MDYINNSSHISETIQFFKIRQEECSWFVCLLLLFITFNIRGHITLVPACSSGTLTYVLPHTHAMQQTPNTTPRHVTVYTHRVDLLLCYLLMWDVILEATTDYFNVIGLRKIISLSFTQKVNFYLNVIAVEFNGKLGRK